MSKPPLTTDLLLQNGFTEVGCWELNGARDLSHQIELPDQAGVYAFAVEGVVHYIGLAAKSVRQRLGFYRKPGAGQRTNLRLNEIIRDHLKRTAIVQILVAHPPDQQWNGFRISGAEGLEAGLIRDFNLVWNVRGSDANLGVTPSASRSSIAVARILALIELRPGMTELEIAKAIYGPSAVQQQVNQQCRGLLKAGRIQRRGTGGVTDPFTYVATKLALDLGSSPG